MRAVVTKGVKAGIHVGRVAARITGSFNITAKHTITDGINYKYCTALQKCDGYSYGHGTPIPSLQKGKPVSSPV